VVQICECETSLIEMGEAVQFYRRKLPEMCTSFNSDEGKKIFKEALDEGEVTLLYLTHKQLNSTSHLSFSLFRVHELLLPTSCSVSYSGRARILWPLNTGHGPQCPGSGSWKSLEGSMEVVGGIWCSITGHLVGVVRI